MTKLLNLDDLPTGDEKTIVLKGKRHQMKPLSVGQFIEQQKTASKLETDDDLSGMVDLLVGTIGRAFPTMPEDELRGLTMGQLQSVFQFLMDQTPEVPEQAKREGK